MGWKDSRPVLRHRSERVVAAGRAILAPMSLVAVWMDPSEPPRFVPATYIILAANLGYALGLLGMVWLPAPGSTGSLFPRT